MKKTLYELFKDFADFWTQLKPRLVKDFRTKDHINFIFFSNRIYDYYKHDTYYGSSDEALGRIFTQIAFDCAEFSKKEAIYTSIYEKTDKLLRYSTETKQRRNVETTNTVPPKTTENQPIYSAQDMLEDSHGFHNRADWLKTVSKQTGSMTSNVKEGIKVAGEGGKTKIIPNYVEVYSQDNAGLARLLGVFSNIDIDLTKYLARYRKFFYSSYGMEGELIKVPGSKRYTFKSYEELEEEEEIKEGKKPQIDKEEAEISFREWSNKFKQGHPGEKPTFQLYTLERLQKNKVKLEKELKKTSGVFRDKINMRLTGNEALIEAFSKEITMPPIGSPMDKLLLEASDEEVKTSTYWARVNRSVGFERFKKMMASFVRGYNLLEAKKIEKPNQLYLLLGPPGVGKTYIAEILAEAMDRPPEMISMNGKKDPSMLFGVPQEWAGAGFGEILRVMMKYKDRAPVIILDEFDKADKLLQKVLGNLTDETVNKYFKDVFMDLAIPINEIIFICTANYPEQIEPFLLSRLTKIYLEPLTFNQRMEVAKDLISYNMAKYEITHLKAKFDQELIKKCLCNEWGVRKLKANIQRIVYEAFLLEGESLLPEDWNDYEWPIEKYEEVDAGDPSRNRPACPYFLDRTAEHRKDCECFKPDLIEGWKENMGA